MSSNYLEVPRISNQVLVKRFLPKIKFTKRHWLWDKKLDKGGYGQFLYKGNKYRPHRISYRYFNGCFDYSLEIQHMCGIPSCVKPECLEVATRKENMRHDFGWALVDGIWYCPEGHEMTPENTYQVPNGRGDCRECRKVYKRNLRLIHAS